MALYAWSFRQRYSKSGMIHKQLFPFTLCDYLMGWIIQNVHMTTNFHFCLHTRSQRGLGTSSKHLSSCVVVGGRWVNLLLGESEASAFLSCHFSWLDATVALFFWLNFLSSAPSWERVRQEAERLLGSAGAMVAPCCYQQQLQTALSAQLDIWGLSGLQESITGLLNVGMLATLEKEV